MTTVQQLYEAMQHIAPLELAESWGHSRQQAIQKGMC